MGCGGSKDLTAPTPDVEAMTGSKESLRRSSRAMALSEGLRISSTNSLNLDRLLQNKAGIAALQAFAETEYAAENVKYWVKAQEYKQLCRSSFVRSVAAGMQLQAIGSAIIKTFLCDGAPEQLNVASDVLAAFKTPPPETDPSPSCDSPKASSPGRSPGDSPKRASSPSSRRKKQEIFDGVYTYTDSLFDAANKGVYQNLKDTFQRFKLSDKAEDLLWAEPLLALNDPAQAFQGNVKVKIKELLKEVQQRCSCDRISAWAIDGGFMYLVAGTGVGNAFIRLPIGEGLVGHAARENRHQVVVDAYEHPKFNKDVDLATGYRTRSVLCVVFSQGDVCRGALQLINKMHEPGLFSDEDAAALQQEFSERFIAICNEAAETLMLEKAKESERPAA